MRVTDRGITIDLIKETIVDVCSINKDHFLQSLEWMMCVAQSTYTHVNKSELLF